MPLPGTHTARQRAPGGCDKIRQDTDKFGDGITPLWCVKGGKAEVESIHFDAAKFSAEEARAWLKKHDYKADQFEEAAKPEPKAAVPPPDFKGDVSVPVESVRGTDVEVAAAPPTQPAPPDVNAPPDLTGPPAKGAGCQPEPGEAADDWMTRCMTDPGMNGDYPDEGGRHAACQVRWEQSHPATAPAAAPAPDLRCVAAGEALTIMAAPGDGSPPRFGLVAYTGVPMKLDGYFHPVIVDLESLKTPRQALPVLRQHDAERIAGHTDSVDVSAQRIKAGGILSGMAEHTADVLHTAKGGFPWQASIGANPQKMEFVPKGEAVKVNGRNWQGPLFVARGATLREISLVPMGADGNTSAAVAAAALAAGKTGTGAGTGKRGGGKMDFEKWLEAAGFDPASLSDSQKQALETGWRAQTAATDRKPDGSGPSVEELAAAGRAEVQRRQRITEMVADMITANSGNLHAIECAEAIGRQAIDGRWELQKAELEFLRAGRPRGPGIAVAREGRPQVDDAVIEAAVSRNAGLRDLEKHYPERTLETCDRHFPRGLSLCDLILTYARRSGYTGTSVKANPESAMKAARRASEIQAGGSWGPSTQGASIGSMLANVANKFLRVGFDSVDMSWRQIAAIRSVNDFKQVSIYSLTGDLKFKQLPPGGEIKHGQIDATSYTNQVSTYARMLGLDRRDIINDDLGAFASVSRRMGRGGALALNTLFWGIFLNNSSFFTSGRNNLITGAGTTLQLSQLDVLNQKFLTQTDPDGQLLGVTPRILLVPPALSVTAQTLMSSTMVVSGATTAPGTPANNPWANAFRVVTSPYLQDASLTGNSSTAWYLLADPSDLPVIEAAFLNGAESPTVESSDSEFNMLGQAFRGYWDIGVSLMEYRGGAKSAGA